MATVLAPALASCDMRFMDVARTDPAVTAPEDEAVPTSADAPPTRRKRHPIRNTLIGIVVAIFAVWLVLFVTKGRFLKSPFESIVGKLTHRTVTVRGDFQLYFAPFRIKFYAEGMTLSNPGWASRPNLFSADRIDSRIAPFSLLFGKRRLYWLDLDNGAVDLEWNADHSANTWTFSDRKGGKPFEFPRIDRADIIGTTVRYLDPRMQVLADLKVDDIASANATIGKAVGVTGGGVLRKAPFTVVARLLTPDATANRGKNQLVARVRAAHNVIDVAGTLPSIADIEDVPLSVAARGRNMAELLGIIGVVIPQTRDYHLRGQLIKSGEVYRFTRIRGVAGATDLAGTLTITNGTRIHLDSKLATKSLDIIDAAPFIGFNPDIVAAKGAQAAVAATGAGANRLLPDAALPIATMQLFDADLKWTIGVVKSRNIPISNVDVTLALDHGKLSLSPFTFSMARGNVASDVIFDTRPPPQRSALRYPPRADADGNIARGLWFGRLGDDGNDQGAHPARRARRHDPRFALHRARPHRLRDAQGHAVDAQRAARRARYRHLRPEDVRG